MVFMTMSQHDTSDFFDIFCQIGYIRDNKVDTQHIIFRESQTAVDDDDIIAVFQHSHVFADFFQTAQRNYLQAHLWFLFGFISRTQSCCHLLSCSFCRICRCFCLFLRRLFHRGFLFFCCRLFRFLCRRFFCILCRTCRFIVCLCFRLCVIFRFRIFRVHILCVFLLCQKTHLLFCFFSHLFL